MTTNEMRTIEKILNPLIAGGMLNASVLRELKTLVGKNKTVEEPIIGRKEARKILGGLTNQTLRNYEKAGLLKPLKLAGKRLVRYYKSNVKSLLMWRSF